MYSWHKILLFLLLLGVGLLSDVQAQSKKCDLIVRAIEAKEKETDPSNEVSDTVIKAANLASGQEKEAKLVSGKPTFANLSIGKYKLSVSRPEYKTTWYIASHLCDVDAKSQLIEIWLWKGSQQEKINFLNETNKSLFGTTGTVVLGSANFPVPLNPLLTNVIKPDSSLARAARAIGVVFVQVRVDESGTVTEAWALTGHPLLKTASVEAAKTAKFAQGFYMNTPTKLDGILIFSFAH